jgi:predicted dehydrogenase
MIRESKLSRREILAGLGAAAGLGACGRVGDGSGADRVGVAVVGLGNLALSRVLPALRDSERCRVAALVSSGPDKMRDVGSRFGVAEAAQYTYDDFDRIGANPDVDFVYILVPNALHSEFAIRAAAAGKHVFCEKPMAVSVEQCQAMIAACEQADRYLAVAYRMQFVPQYREMIRLASERAYGHVRLVRAEIGFPVGEGDTWRLKRSLAGGGALMEMGVYAVQAGCHLAGEDPTTVSGFELPRSDPGRFREVEESVAWSMEFADGSVTQCAACYSTKGLNRIWAGAEGGYFSMHPAFSLKRLEVETSSGSIRKPQVDQFVAQLDEFARCIQEKQAPVYGTALEGMRDVKVITRIYESIATGSRVRVA